MDQCDPWQVVPRQVFTPYDCLLISVGFVGVCRVGCLWVAGVGRGSIVEGKTSACVVDWGT